MSGFPMIEVENTPNPKARKFLLGEKFAAGIEVEFSSFADARSISQLAASLLEIDEVEKVFMANDFVAISIKDEGTWQNTMPLVLEVIEELREEKKPFIDPAFVKKKSGEKKDVSTATGPVVDKIKELIAERVRPAVAMDGGDIVFHDFKDGVVYLTLHGACRGCPGAAATLKDGVENLLKHFIPEVKRVERVED